MSAGTFNAVIESAAIGIDEFGRLELVICFETPLFSQSAFIWLGCDTIDKDHYKQAAEGTMFITKLLKMLHIDDVNKMKGISVQVTCGPTCITSVKDILGKTTLEIP